MDLRWCNFKLFWYQQHQPNTSSIVYNKTINLVEQTSGSETPMTSKFNSDSTYEETGLEDGVPYTCTGKWADFNGTIKPAVNSPSGSIPLGTNSQQFLMTMKHISIF